VNKQQTTTSTLNNVNTEQTASLNNVNTEQTSHLGISPRMAFQGSVSGRPRANQN